MLVIVRLSMLMGYLFVVAGVHQRKQRKTRAVAYRRLKYSTVQDEYHAVTLEYREEQDQQSIALA